MHRSGTSALTKTLGLCGATLPRHLMASSTLNPMGFFESEPIYQLHEQLLAEAGTSWDDLAPFPESWIDSPVAGDFIDRMAEVVRTEFGESRLFVVKDPRLCRLIPFWRRVLKKLAVEPGYVIAIRNPLEVAASLKRAQSVAELRGLLLWLQHFLMAERDSRKSARSFVSYDALLTDWRTIVQNIGRDLRLAFPRLSRRAAAEVDAFINHELRHHQEKPGELTARHDVVDWVKEVNAWATRAAAGEAPGYRKIDRIWATYLAAETAFGPVLASSDLEREASTYEAERLRVEVAQLKQELTELQTQVVPSAQDSRGFEARLQLRDRQVTELVECIKLMLVWIASSMPGGEAAGERLRALLQALDSSEAESIPAIATNGLQRYRDSMEIPRLQEESRGQFRELEQLHRQLEERDSRANELQQQLERQTKRTEELEQQLRKRLADMQELKQQLGQRLADMQDLEQQLVAADREIGMTHRAGSTRGAEEGLVSEEPPASPANRADQNEEVPAERSESEGPHESESEVSEQGGSHR